MFKQFFKLFGFVIAVYAVNFIGARLGVYGVWPFFDTPMHFLGGAAVAVTGLVAWDMGLGQGKGSLSSIPFIVKAFAIVGFVAMVGIVWEWHEFFRDFLRALSGLPYSPAQPSIGDTMKDLFLDLLGGVTAFACSYIRGIKRGK